MESLGEKFKRVLALKGMTMKALAAEIGVTEQGLSKMLKNDSMRVDVLNRAIKAMGATADEWYDFEYPVQPSQNASGIGNAVGDSNKSKVQIGKKMSGRQEVYGMGIDEIYIKLLTCEKDRDVLKTERDSFARERDSYKSMVAQQAQLIERLSTR